MESIASELTCSSVDDHCRSLRFFWLPVPAVAQTGGRFILDYLSGRGRLYFLGSTVWILAYALHNPPSWQKSAWTTLVGYIPVDRVLPPGLPLIRFDDLVVTRTKLTP